jgi:hypothetical protein
MRKKRVLMISVVLVLSMFLSGCGASAPANGSVETLKADLKNKEDIINVLMSEKEALLKDVNELQAQINLLQSNSVLNTALNVAEILKDKDMAALSLHVHPNKGLRFTPYSYVDLQGDLVFTSQQITTLLQSSQIHNWGSFDGTGDPIQLNFNDYYDRFVYDQDYANPHMIGNNVEIGAGNSINNIAQTYPAGVFVEFHFTGFDPQYAGMDWRSLRLVFEDVNGTWYLVGIVHNEWTI